MQVAKAFAALVGLLTLLAFIIDPSPHAPKEKAYVATMKADLRNLVTAQEGFFAESLRYAAALDSTAYQTSPGVSVFIQLRGDSAWSATATHVYVVGGSCRISVSFDGQPTATEANDGEPVCEPAQQRRSWRFIWER